MVSLRGRTVEYTTFGYGEILNFRNLFIAIENFEAGAVPLHSISVTPRKLCLAPKVLLGGHGIVPFRKLHWYLLHFCRHKTGRKHHVRQCFQFPYLPNRWKYRYLQCFLQFFHVPMPVGIQLQHIYKKSFQNIVFDSVFPMFPVKQTVIYTFFAIKAVNPSKTLLLTVFL